MVTHGTLDIDPFPIEVHGKQPGGAYHGYYRKTIYQPLVASFCAAGSFGAHNNAPRRKRLRTPKRIKTVESRADGQIAVPASEPPRL